MSDFFERSELQDYWGRIVVAIGGNQGRQELERVLDEVADIHYRKGEQDEKERVAREVANRLLGNGQRLCSWCKKYYTPKEYELAITLSETENSYICDSCIPF